MKKLKAQQITEFMLAAPLLVIFLIILTEFAFGLNANLVLASAVKSSVSAYIAAINTDSEKQDFEDAVKNYIKIDVEKNNLPNRSSLQTRLITVGDYPAVISTYTYTPGFNYAFLPALREINMGSASVFPLKAPKLEGYEEAISTEELDALVPQINSGAESEEDGI